jgi:GTPase SAR1 family protein
LLVFDLNNHKSFTASPAWHRQLLEQTGKGLGDLVIILIGGKSDLEHKVQLPEIQDLASQLRIPTYIQTSAKKGDRIDEVFDQLLEKLITGSRRIITKDTIEIKPMRKKGRGQGKCCVK